MLKSASQLTKGGPCRNFAYYSMLIILSWRPKGPWPNGPPPKYSPANTKQKATQTLSFLTCASCLFVNHFLVLLFFIFACCVHCEASSRRTWSRARTAKWLLRHCNRFQALRLTFDFFRENLLLVQVTKQKSSSSISIINRSHHCRNHYRH